MNRVLFLSDDIETIEPVLETFKKKDIFINQLMYKNNDRINYGLFNVVFCFFKVIDEVAIDTLIDIRKATKLPVGVITYTTKDKTVNNLYNMGMDRVFDANCVNEDFKEKLITFVYRYKYLFTHNDPQIVKIQNFKFDFNRYTAFYHDKPIELTPKQFELFLLLLSMDGHILTNDYINKTLWMNDKLASKNSIASLISRTNKKFTEVSDLKPLDALHGKGYRFNRDLIE